MFILSDVSLAVAVVIAEGLAKLGNIVAETMFLVMFPGVAKMGNICFGCTICVREAKMFLFPLHMFPARLNRETFASATMFLQQCFLV